MINIMGSLLQPVVQSGSLKQKKSRQQQTTVLQETCSLVYHGEISFAASSAVRKSITEEIKAITDNYSVDKEIGRGAFGRVFRGTFHHTEVAVKVLRKVICSIRL